MLSCIKLILSSRKNFDFCRPRIVLCSAYERVRSVLVLAMMILCCCIWCVDQEMLTRLQQELNTRFLQDRGLLPPSPAGPLTVHAEMHQHQHQHLHHHQHHLLSSTPTSSHHVCYSSLDSTQPQIIELVKMVLRIMNDSHVTGCLVGSDALLFSSRCTSVHSAAFC